MLHVIEGHMVICVCVFVGMIKVIYIIYIYIYKQGIHEL